MILYGKDFSYILRSDMQSVRWIDQQPDGQQDLQPGLQRGWCLWKKETYCIISQVILIKEKDMDRTGIIHDFKQFMDQNRTRLSQTAINASDIPADDEWMQENKWDEIYMQERESAEYRRPRI